MSTRRTFLVPSGYNFRAVLAFCRALRQAGETPAIIARHADDPIWRTGFAREVVLTRSGPALELADFAAAARRACARTGADRVVLAPTSEYLVRWALRHRSALANRGCDLPLPDEATYLTITDKAAFTSFARARGMPVPAEIEDLAEMKVPAVAKPRWNVSPEGRSLYPWLFRSPADLTRFAWQEKARDFFFQEWVEGRSFYLLIYLPSHGEPTVYSQENLAQQPGGKSILLARGARLHETSVASRWTDVLRAAGFFGLVMIELRQRGAEYVLIEANPRLWGPLQLCLEGCPSLLFRYIAEHTGGELAAAERRRVPARPYYLWRGGLVPGTRSDWHGGAPLWPQWTLTRRVGADVYLRADSWRQYFHEQWGVAPAASGTAIGQASHLGSPH